MNEADRLLSGLLKMDALGVAINLLDPADATALDQLLCRAVDVAASLVDRGSAELIFSGEGELPCGPNAGVSAESGAEFPLMVGGKRLAALRLHLPPGRVPEPPERALLLNLATMTAGALLRAGTHQDSRRSLARKEDELALLRHAGLLISSRTGLQDTLDAILTMALEVTGARYGIFRLLEKKRNALVMAAIAGSDLGRPAVEALPVNVTSVMGMVAKTQQPVIIADVREPPWSKIYYPLDLSLQMRAELAVPLIGAGGRLEGVLNLESPQVGAFTEGDSHLLQSLASQAVIAIQEVRLLDALRDTAARVLSQDAETVLAHLQLLREELVSGDTEWDRKISAILSQYAELASENAIRQQALREEREARLVAETFAAMGDVAANLLHHLNNKVGTIPVRIEGIQDKCGPQIAQSPYLASNLVEIERAALDAMKTVRERLSLLHPITPAPVRVIDCLSEALRAARLPADVIVEQGAELATLPPVLASREGLTLVLLNLLENAGEALAGRGRLAVSGALVGGLVEIVVADDGPGIPAEVQGRIFDFAFSSQRREGRSGRLGFGLWWVKTLISRSGGSITVESDGRTGSSFRFRLPKG